MESIELATTEGEPGGRLRSGGQAQAAHRPRHLIYVVLGLAALVSNAIMGMRYPDDRDYAVSPGVVLIAGPVVQVGAPEAGRVRHVNVDVGDLVQGGQILATIERGVLPGEAMTGTRLVDVSAPVRGVVVGRYTNTGNTLQPGELLFALTELQP